MDTQKLLSNLSLMLKMLSEKERAIIIMRYGFVDGVQHTLEECGKQFNVTRERIRQIEGKAHEKLRQIIKGIDFTNLQV